MRALVGRGTPKQLAQAACGLLWILQAGETWALAFIVTDIGEEPAFLIIAVVPKARWKSLTSATGC